MWILSLASSILSIAVVLYLMRGLSEIRKINRQLRAMNDAHVSVINGLLDRAVGIRCDDCGNVMERGRDHMTVVLDGDSVYIGHRSHGRQHDG